MSVDDQIYQCEQDIAKLQENLKELKSQKKTVYGGILTSCGKRLVCVRNTSELRRYMEKHENRGFIFVGADGYQSFGDEREGFSWAKNVELIK